MPQTLYLIPFAILAVGIPLASFIARTYCSNKIERLYKEAKFDELLTYLDSKLVSFLFPDFNRIFTRLNTYMAQGNTKDARLSVDALLASDLSPQQLVAVIPQAFSVYMSEGDYKAAEPLVEQAETVCPKTTAQEMRVSYDIVAKKSYEYLERMEESYEKGDFGAKMQLAPLIALQYDNKGDKKKVKEWRAKLNELMESAQDA